MPQVAQDIPPGTLGPSPQAKAINQETYDTKTRCLIKKRHVFKTWKEPLFGFAFGFKPINPISKLTHLPKEFATSDVSNK